MMRPAAAGWRRVARYRGAPSVGLLRATVGTDPVRGRDFLRLRGAGARHRRLPRDPAPGTPARPPAPRTEGPARPPRGRGLPAASPVAPGRGDAAACRAGRTAAAHRPSRSLRRPSTPVMQAAPVTRQWSSLGRLSRRHRCAPPSSQRRAGSSSGWARADSSGSAAPASRWPASSWSSIRSTRACWAPACGLSSASCWASRCWSAAISCGASPPPSGRR